MAKGYLQTIEEVLGYTSKQMAKLCNMRLSTYEMVYRLMQLSEFGCYEADDMWLNLHEHVEARFYALQSIRRGLKEKAAKDVKAKLERQARMRGQR